MTDNYESDDVEDRAEFMIKLQEVAKHNTGFSELVKKYMDENG